MWTGFDQPLGFAVVPFLVFAGFRFGQQGGTVTTLIAVLTALFVTIPSVGLVAEGTASQRLTYQSVFMIFVSTTTMLLTALIAQRSAAFEALRESNLRIEREAAERERLEAELLQASKMEAVGRLAGGVAHDFNNLLTAILGYAELVRDGVEDPTVRRDVDQIRQAASRASHLTQQLLAFARRQVVETRPVSIGTLALNLEPFLRRLIGEHIELVIETAPDLWPVKADRGQLEQVLVNLSVNARDAMPDGGRLSIETSNLVVTTANAAEHPGVALGELVRLIVSDTGQGIVESAREHIFEPYFTTKERGKGTGLGLATCYGIVTASGGQITVESAEGEGATFRVYLPRATEALVEDAPLAEVDVPRGSETVLVVEDETLVRAVAVRSLRASGYRVLEAENGEAALELVAGLPRSERIDLLLTDLMMPIMGGRELADRMRALRPEIAVLYVSGYSDDVLGGWPEGTGTSFLEKPFTPADLARRVRQIIDGGYDQDTEEGGA
jgi:two-component system, cell cycle sensor histidine kinase and response regulator CckA